MIKIMEQMCLTTFLPTKKIYRMQRKTENRECYDKHRSRNGKKRPKTSFYLFLNDFYPKNDALI